MVLRARGEALPDLDDDEDHEHLLHAHHHDPHHKPNHEHHLLFDLHKDQNQHNPDVVADLLGDADEHEHSVDLCHPSDHRAADSRFDLYGDRLGSALPEAS